MLPVSFSVLSTVPRYNRGLRLKKRIIIIIIIIIDYNNNNNVVLLGVALEQSSHAHINHGLYEFFLVLSFSCVNTVASGPDTS